MYANHRSGFKHPSVPASASQVPHYDESDYVDQQYNGYADEPAPTQAPVHQQRRQEIGRASCRERVLRLV